MELLHCAGPLGTTGPLLSQSRDPRTVQPKAPPSSVSSSPTSPTSGALDSPSERTFGPQCLTHLGSSARLGPPNTLGCASGSRPQLSRQPCLMPPPRRWCQCLAAGGNSPCAAATADRAASGRGERVHGEDRGAGEAAQPGPEGAGDPAGEVGALGRARGSGFPRADRWGRLDFLPPSALARGRAQ